MLCLPMHCPYSLSESSLERARSGERPNSSELSGALLECSIAIPPHVSSHDSWDMPYMEPLRSTPPSVTKLTTQGADS
jgi:hypothetical protein